MNRTAIALIFTSALAVIGNAQARMPSTASKPYLVKTRQQVADIDKELAKQNGNKNLDLVPYSGTQMRVAVFHDEKRENDNFEVHDRSDDVYYVLEGKATLSLGGQLVDPKEVSAGEWRSKVATGGQKVEIRKGDLIVVPRGTVHQRTVTGKGFSMILIKVFEETAKP